MITIYYSFLDKQLSPDKWKYYTEHLSPTVMQKINKLMRWEDRQASLFGKLLLKKALQQHGYDSLLINELQFTGFGKPFLDIPLKFNISHSGKYVICAVTNDAAIGCDIEEIQEVKFDDFKLVLRPDEFTDIQSSATPLHRFFTYWSVKESVIKADGRGLSLPLKELYITGDRVTYKDSVWHLFTPFIHTNYSVSIACEAPVDESKIVEVSF